MHKLKCYQKLFSLIAIMGSLVLTAVSADCATYYVRVDGGTASECNGLSDLPYSGSGTNQNCAFEHPSWVQAPQGSPTILKGGDTLIIDGSNNAEYMIGYGAPNSIGTNKCHPSWPYDCYWQPIPSGPDPAHPTRILGKGWDTGCANPPQLWGNERVTQIINMNGSDNIELQCLDITDHSECQEHGPIACNRKTKPFGPWARIGLRASDSENVLLKNIQIHGIANKGMHVGRLKDWTLEDTSIIANSFVGWDGDIGEFRSSNSGTMTFNRVKIQYNGCGETYPGRQVHNCYGQSYGGYGDGIGTHQTGADWVFNESDISHNVSDGLDLLYHDGSGTVTIKRSRFEGNAGNQLKIATNALVENSIIIGNCGYFADKSYGERVSKCRAGGNSLVLSYHAGMKAEIYNSTITGSGDTIVMSREQTVCNGTEKLITRNNIFLGGDQFGHPDTTALYYAAGKGGNGDGLCGDIVMNDDYSVIWATKRMSCDGKEHSKCEDPKFNEPSVQFYYGDAWDVSLRSTSPAIGGALILTGKSSLDFDKKERGSEWDIGALERDSSVSEFTCADGIEYCSTQEDCTGQEYYWYNGACNVNPESLPTCAEGVLYCSSSSECTGQGHYWYNNICNFSPEPEPTCVDSILYCSNSVECSTQGHYWYNNTCNSQPEAEACVPTWCDLPLIECGQEPLTGGTDSCGNSCTKPSAEWPNCIEPEPTCADGPQYCSSSSECDGQGYHWYNAICNIDPQPLPTCVDGIQYCITSAECVANNHYWYDGNCNAEPKPIPTCADDIEYCLTSTNCIIGGYYWYDSTCNSQPEPEPTCANDGIQYCTKRSDCTKQGYYWYDNACHVQDEVIMTCADGIQFCTKRQDCEKQGYYWYNNACNVQPEFLPTCADGIQYCLTSSECTSNGHYWYNSTCNTEPEPQPVDETGTLNKTTIEPVTVESTETLLFASITDETTTDPVTSDTSEEPSDNKGPKPKDTKIKTIKKSTTEGSGGGGGSSGGGGSKGGSSGSFGGGGGLFGSGSTGRSKSGDSSKKKSSRSSSGGGTGTISGPTGSTVTTSGTSSGSSDGDGTSVSISTTDTAEIDLEGETYTELQKELQKELLGSEAESEMEGEGEEETVEGEELSGEEEKSFLEEFQEGVQGVWDNIVNWFFGFGGNK